MKVGTKQEKRGDVASTLDEGRCSMRDLVKRERVWKGITRQESGGRESVDLLKGVGSSPKGEGLSSIC